MLRFATWKLASVLALVAAAVLVILPSFMPSQAVDALAARFPSFIPMRQIVLGLDLQGGAYLLMEVDTAVGDQEPGRGAARRRAAETA